MFVNIYNFEIAKIVKNIELLYIGLNFSRKILSTIFICVKMRAQKIANQNPLRATPLPPRPPIARYLRLLSYQIGLPSSKGKTL